jgi:hypothetical protein
MGRGGENLGGGGGALVGNPVPSGLERGQEGGRERAALAEVNHLAQREPMLVEALEVDQDRGLSALGYDSHGAIIARWSEGGHGRGRRAESMAQDERADWRLDSGGLLGHTRAGTPVWLISGAAPEEGEGEGEGGGQAGGSGAGTGGSGGGAGNEGAADDKPTDWENEAKRWKARAREAEARAKKGTEAAERLAALEDASKSDLEKAQEKAAELERRAADAEAHALRLEVAHDKGLSPSQAKRLVGATKEELEADAEELLGAFSGAGSQGAGQRAGAKPREALRAGASPAAEPEETDPRKLADKIPRA